MNKPTDEDPAKEKQEYLKEWLRRHQQARRQEPEVVRMLSTANWLVDATEELRRRSPAMAREVDAELRRGVKTLKDTLPLPPEYGVHLGMATTTASVSSASVVFDALISAGDQMSQPDGAIVPITVRYGQLQDEQQRTFQAADRLVQVFPALSERFSEASGAAHIALGSPSAFAEEAAAMAMRTFLHKLKGELIDKARHYEGQNVPWPLIAERLCTGSNVQVFLEQERVHSTLNDWLSKIGKGRFSAFTFKDSWMRFIDHIYVVCGAVLARETE